MLPRRYGYALNCVLCLFLFFFESHVQAAGDFTISVTPSSLSLLAGTSVAYTINITDGKGFKGAVAVTVGGLPSGASAASINIPSGATSASDQVQTNTSTPAGTYSLSFTGTSGSLSHTATATLVVTSDFTISSSHNISVTPGNSGSATISIGSVGGFSRAVSLSSSGAPAGATTTFGPASVAAPGNSTLTVNTTNSIAPGSYTITVTGTSGGSSHSVTISLYVNAAGSDFSISLNPLSQASAPSVINGTFGNQYAVAVTGTAGFNDQVTLTATGSPLADLITFVESQPSGLDLNPCTLTVPQSPGVCSNLGYSFNSGTAFGSYSFTISGTSLGGITHSITGTLILQSGVSAFQGTIEQANGTDINSAQVLWVQNGIPIGTVPNGNAGCCGGGHLVYVTDNLAPGSYALFASAPSYKLSISSPTVAVVNNDTVQNFVLPPLPTTNAGAKEYVYLNGKLFAVEAGSFGPALVDFSQYVGSNTGQVALPPLTVGVATFSGGQIFPQTSGIAADTSAVYGTFNIAPSGWACSGCTSTMTISFSGPVSHFSMLLVNGMASTVAYTVTDDKGDQQQVTIPANSISASATVILPSAGIRQVAITGGISGNWSFFADNIQFTP